MSVALWGLALLRHFGALGPGPFSPFWRFGAWPLFAILAVWGLAPFRHYSVAYRVRRPLLALFCITTSMVLYFFGMTEPFWMVFQALVVSLP